MLVFRQYKTSVAAMFQSNSFILKTASLSCLLSLFYFLNSSTASYIVLFRLTSICELVRLIFFMVSLIKSSRPMSPNISDDFMVI